MNSPAVDLERATSAWQESDWPKPDVLLVSGSGLGVDLGYPIVKEAPLSRWLPFPGRAIEGHPLTTQILRPRPECTVLYQRGRIHSYQGHDAHEVVFVVRLAALLGARVLIMTNAAGSLDPRLTPGSMVLIKDHLNLIGLNPLRGSVPASWGPQFPDMSEPYDPRLRKVALEIAEEEGYPLPEGVYAGVSGPSYETPAEVEMLRRLGADLVGMSTVLEVIAARHMNVRCLGISVVSNLAPGVGTAPVDHTEVLSAGAEISPRLTSLLQGILSAPELLA